MDRYARLVLVARVTYYVGWIALVCGAVFHFVLATAGTLFVAIRIFPRTLFEASLLLFIICIASELRALGAARRQAT